MNEKNITKEDARGIAIKAIIDKIGYGITWETAQQMIVTVLNNWDKTDKQ